MRSPLVCSENGNVIAWDSDCALLGCPEPGRQIFKWVHGVTSQVTHDPTGSSVNPALCLRDTCLAFESRGDLAGANPAGTTQIFLNGTDGSFSQVSRGQAASHNAGLDRAGQRIVFDSTGNLSGADTSISQIWLLTPPGPVLFGMPSDPGGLQIGDALRIAQCDVGLVSCAFTCAPFICPSMTSTTLGTTTTTTTSTTTAQPSSTGL